MENLFQIQISDTEKFTLYKQMISNKKAFLKQNIHQTHKKKYFKYKYFMIYNMM